MPMPQNLDWVNGLPPSLQFAVMIGVGFAMFLWARSGFLAGKKEPPVTTKDVVLTAASIMDMEPVRGVEIKLGNLVHETKRVADILDNIHAILHARQLADAAADEDELRDRIRDLERSLADASRPPEQRRRLR